MDDDRSAVTAGGEVPAAQGQAVVGSEGDVLLNGRGDFRRVSDGEADRMRETLSDHIREAQIGAAPYEGDGDERRRDPRWLFHEAAKLLRRGPSV